MNLTENQGNAWVICCSGGVPGGRKIVIIIMLYEMFCVLAFPKVLLLGCECGGVEVLGKGTDLWKKAAGEAPNNEYQSKASKTNL